MSLRFPNQGANCSQPFISTSSPPPWVDGRIIDLVGERKPIQVKWAGVHEARASRSSPGGRRSGGCAPGYEVSTPALPRPCRPRRSRHRSSQMSSRRAASAAGRDSARARSSLRSPRRGAALPIPHGSLAHAAGPGSRRTVGAPLATSHRLKSRAREGCAIGSSRPNK